MDELFDVFDDQTPGETPSSKQTPKKDKSKKRLASGEAKDTNGTTKGDGDVSILEAPPTEHPAANGDSQPDAKRQRREVEAEPLVTDTFETEQSREVAASAGLQAAKEGTAVVLSHQVRHQVALPPDYDYVPISEHKAPEKPARTWPFTLDPFQQVSIASIERGESVLVSATHQRWEDCGCRVCDCSKFEEQPEGHLHQSHQSSEQPKIQRIFGRIRRRGVDDRRRDDQSHRDMSCHDHRDSAVDVV